MEKQTKQFVGTDLENIRKALIGFEVKVGIGSYSSSPRESKLTDYRIGQLVGMMQSIANELLSSVE